MIFYKALITFFTLGSLASFGNVFYKLSYLESPWTQFENSPKSQYIYIYKEDLGESKINENNNKRFYLIDSNYYYQLLNLNVWELYEVIRKYFSELNTKSLNYFYLFPLKSGYEGNFDSIKEFIGLKIENKEFNTNPKYDLIKKSFIV